MQTGSMAIISLDSVLSHYGRRRILHYSDDFWMGTHEVTNALYRRYRADHDSLEHFQNNLNADEQPVVYTTCWAMSGN